MGQECYDTNRQWLLKQETKNGENGKIIQDLHYQYDRVGNITEIEQTADKPTWFGGPYIQTHQYDAQNRLIRADMLSDDIGLYSNYNLSYSPSGMVGNKTCDDMLWDYWYGYKRGNNDSLLNHQVRSIYDLYNDNTSFLQWNADGQLQAIVRPCTGDMRHHWWNEAGQLVVSIDNASCGYYGYDGNGNRAYKLTGQSVQDQHNAGERRYHVNFNDAVLYVNPYFVVTPKGYTKHYYNGSQRIASKIGRISDLPTDIIDTSDVALERIANAQAYMASVLGATAEKIDISTGDIADIDGDELEELQWQCLDTNTIVFHITLNSDTNMLLSVLSRDAEQTTKVQGVYYYHADHLGSASWITNKSGTPIEYIHYMPYGELWYDWQASSYNERFKFTGKERDAETGYDYFGARFYSPLLLLWLSPDPLADKYPSISSYAYCKWNPVKHIDPNGKDAKMIVSGNTITFRATYYAHPTNMESVTRAVNFWNKQTDLQYTDNRGNTYSVKFNLSVKKSDNLHNSVNLGGADANSYEVVPQLSAETSTPNARATGLTKDNRAIEVRSDRANGLTGAHEVGHTLMNVNTKDGEHSTSGIMTGNANDPQRGEYVSQETVNTMVESHGINDNSIWSKIKSVFE